MTPIETSSSASFYIGHVRNGVVVLDPNASLSEGQAVRVEPMGAINETLNQERIDRVRQLQGLFKQWTQEDAQIPLEEADRLHSALDENRGLKFRQPEIR